MTDNNSVSSIIIEKKPHIDLLKFMAMIFVVLYHSQTYSLNLLENVKNSYYYLYYFRTILATCVPLFFFTNGYLIFNKPLFIKKHIYKTLRLIILTFFWGIVGLLLIMNIEGTILNAKDFFTNLWIWRPIGWINHLWYMGALICIYLIFPILKTSYDSNQKVLIYFLIVCTCLTFGNTFVCEVASITTNIFTNSGTIYSTNLFNMFNPLKGIYGYTFVYFCLGGLTYNFENKLNKIAKFNRTLIPLIIMLLSCFGLWGMGLYFTHMQSKIWDVIWNGYDTIFTLVNVVCIYLLSLNYNGNNKFITLVSNNTLGIYFIHNILIRLTKPYIVSIPIMRNLIANILYALIIISLCTLICVVLKKFPITKKLIS